MAKNKHFIALFKVLLFNKLFIYKLLIYRNKCKHIVYTNYHKNCQYFFVKDLNNLIKNVNYMYVFEILK